MNAAQEVIKVQIHERSMEARTTKLESDVEHIKQDLPRIHGKLDAANQAIVAVTKTVDVLEATQAMLVKQVDNLSSAQATTGRQIDAMGKQVESITATQGGLATKAELNKVEGELKESIAQLAVRIEANNTSMIRWFVCTAIAIGALAFAAARVPGISAGNPTVAANSSGPGIPDIRVPSGHE